MKKTSINKLAKRVHQAHIKWWQDINTGKPIARNYNSLLMLVVTELAEAAEGVRKNLMDDKLKHRRMEEVEMADAYIRVLDMAGGFKIKLLDEKPDSVVNSDKLAAILDVTACVTRICDISYRDYHLTDILSAIEGYCEHFGLDLFGAMEEKLEFNSKRKDHTHEHRRSKHGKKV